MNTLIITNSRDGRYEGAMCAGVMACMRSPHFAGWMRAEDESDIARGRSRALEMALGQKADAFLFVDDDMFFGPSQFDKIASAPVAIVGGLYQKRRPEGGLVFRGLPGGQVEHSKDPDLLAVAGVGTGFLRITRLALEAMLDDGVVEKVNAAQPWHWWFRNGIYDGEYLSEDYGFCAMARWAGLTVWLHRGVRLGHTGKAVYHA